MSLVIRQLLGTTHHSEVEARVASGLPIHEMTEQIRLELRRSLSEQHALLFAEPNANAATGQIQWYASTEGKARRLSELPTEERQAAEARLARLTTDIEAHAARLSRSGVSQDQHVAKALNDALEIPRETDIFMVGAQPVVAAWGHVLRGAAMPRHILRTLAERAKPPAPPPSPVVEPPPAEQPAPASSDPTAAVVTPPVTPPSGSESEVTKRRRPRLWVWLGLILLGLLLAVLVALWLADRIDPRPAPPSPVDPGDVPTPGVPPPVTKPPPGVLACSAATSSGRGTLTRNRHYLGDKPGLVTIRYEMHSVPDEMRVYYRGRVVATTGRPVSGTGTLSFRYQPEDAIYTVLVEVASAEVQTGWDYTLGCPQ